MATIKEIVDAYISYRRKCVSDEYQYYATLPTLKKVISIAALGQRPDGGRHFHQALIRSDALKSSERQLLAVQAKIAKVKNFAELHQLVKLHILSPQIQGIGVLTVYDTALRIGAKLGVEPKEVYLHAGTREGARILGLDVARESIPLTEFHPQFKRLKPREIEDALCHYRIYLNNKKPLPQETRGC